MLNPDSNSLTAKLPIALEPQPPPSHPPSEQNCSSPGETLTPSKERKSGTGECTTVCTVTLSSTRRQAQPSSQFACCLLYSCIDSVTEYCRLITTRCSSAEYPNLARSIVNAIEELSRLTTRMLNGLITYTCGIQILLGL